MLDTLRKKTPDQLRLDLRLVPNRHADITLPTKAAALRVNTSKGPRTRCCLVAILALVLGIVFLTPRNAVAQSTFTNPTRVADGFSTELSPATPYPSSIAVSGLTGSVAKVTVTLHSLNFGSPTQADILLVGPEGQSLIIMSDAPGDETGHIINKTLTFDDEAVSPLPSNNTLRSGTYKPTNFGSEVDFFPTPAPVGPYGNTLSVFDGKNPNGTWRLYEVDDTPDNPFDDFGPDVEITGGWSLTVTTQATPTPTPVVTPSWSFTGSLNTAREAHTATLLQNGKVLVAGGDGRTAELYDPITGTWTNTGNLNTARLFHSATLLQNGKVLVAGGSGFGSVLNSAELYDPATGSWTITGNLNVARDSHTATLLLNGKVLVAGGSPSLFNATSSAELYDPATETWSITGSLLDLNLDQGGARFFHTATLLPNGQVLVAGGETDDGISDVAELYDPSTGVWTITGRLNTRRGEHTATLLPNGKVLVAGGQTSIGNGFSLTAGAELYDPSTGNWSATGSLNMARHFQTETLLPDGRVLVAGGSGSTNASNTSLNTAELYYPSTGTWSLTSSLNTGRYWQTATLLSSGQVLVAGGFNNTSGTLNTAELYDSGAISNPIDDAQFFVRQHYLDFLNRDPDQGGLAYWTEQITQCGSDVRCIHERRNGVSAAFFVEMEFQDTGYYVYRFYKASFGRQPNYAEFTADRAKVIGGSNLEASKQDFADEWIQRSAFTQAYPITMSNAEVVNKLFDSAGLTASTYDAQRQQAIAAMNAGRSRALVLRDVIEIPDFKNIPDPNDPRYAELKQINQYNPAFVLMQYFGYLHRDLDRTGYDFWLDVVNNREPNNYHGMVCSFITSTEYQLRFGSVATRSNADCSR